MSILGIIFLISAIISLFRGILHKTRNIIPDPIPDNVDGIQYVGHGTLLIQLDNIKIITDPILTKTVGRILRRFVSVGIQESALSDIEVVLISHWHTDHFQIQSLRKFSLETTILVPVGLKKKLLRYGFKKVFEIKPGSHFKYKSINIDGVPTEHRTAAGALGYIIKGSWNIYFPGDTALSEKKMTSIGHQYPIDVALLPIGCFRGYLLGFIPMSFRSIHMAPEDVILANSYLQARAIIPIHWGTFIIGTEPINEAMEKLLKIQSEDGHNIQILNHGEWHPKTEFF